MYLVLIVGCLGELSYVGRFGKPSGTECHSVLQGLGNLCTGAYQTPRSTGEPPLVFHAAQLFFDPGLDAGKGRELGQQAQQEHRRSYET